MTKLHCVQDFYNGGTFLVTVDIPELPENGRDRSKLFARIAEMIEIYNDMDFEKDALHIIVEEDTESLTLDELENIVETKLTEDNDEDEEE
jgi:hypothetical protein